MESRLSDYDYDFPEELIAQRAKVRGESEILLVEKSRAVTDLETILAKSLVDVFQPGDCLVVNNTRVIPARLLGKKPTGGRVEALLVQPAAEENSPDEQLWEAWVKPGRSLRVGARTTFGSVEAEVREVQEDGTRILAFSCDTKGFQELLRSEGHVPLPPYIQREDDERDRSDYQSVFAEKDGAVAAPTASFHFSEEMTAALRAKGVHFAELTLHVSPGTFQPVQEEDYEEHKIHGERYELSAASARVMNDAREQGGRLICIGTTAARVVETVANEDGLLSEANGVTFKYIYPGYRWKAVDGLLTNFHWPKSTLLLLVASLLGKEKCLEIYGEVINRRMRLFSYGDGMLILR